MPQEERRRSRSRETTPTSSRRHGSRETTPKLAEREPIVPQGAKPWWIKAPPEELKVHELEPLTMRCIVEGEPKPVGQYI